jgi:thiosulfate/3-mercaptopyruvate sulfurtransferase
MSEKVLVTPAELSDMAKSEPIVLIDTRDPATYAAGHLPNAVNIHDIFTYLATSTPEGVATMRDKFAGISARRDCPARRLPLSTSSP